jgi:hypothetical protein
MPFVFLPWFSLQCDYPEADVSYSQYFSYMDSRLETFKPWTWSSISRITSKPFIGRLDPNSITLSRAVMRKKFITPVAHAKIQARQGATHIHVDIRPHTVVIVGLSTLLLFLLIFFLAGVTQLFSQPSWEALKTFMAGLQGVGMGIALIYFLHQLWFTTEIRSIESLFKGAAASMHKQ